MKSMYAALAVSAVLAGPLQAQIEVPGTETPSQPAPDAPQAEESTPLFDMVERLLRRFITDMEPQLRAFEHSFSELEPEIQRLLGELRDMTQYHPPEVLPNGDIVIRRRQSEAPELEVPAAPGSEGELPFEL